MDDRPRKGGVVDAKANAMRRPWRKPVRRALLALAGAAGLLAAGCGPVPPKPNADYQMYALTPRQASPDEPESCAATPGPRLSWVLADASAVWSAGQQIESVDGVNEHVMHFSRGLGLSLSPTTGEVRNDAYSIVMLFRLSELVSTFEDFDRLIDFKGGTADTGLYLQSGRLRFYPNSMPGNRVIASNEWAQVVITRTATGTVRGFVDGAQQWQFTDSLGDAILSSHNQLVFFRDNLSGGATTEHSAGAVARIRVFDRALSTTEIAALGQTPSSPCTA
jgi:hypothetical protein